MLKPRLNVMNLISKYLKGKILDAGCGDGRNTVGFRNVIGIDIDESQLEIAKKRLEGLPNEPRKKVEIQEWRI